MSGNQIEVESSEEPHQPSKQPSSPKYFGVTYNSKTKRYLAKYSFSGRKIYLGSFSNPLNAARAYDDHARIMREHDPKMKNLPINFINEQATAERTSAGAARKKMKVDDNDTQEVLTGNPYDGITWCVHSKRWEIEVPGAHELHNLGSSYSFDAATKKLLRGLEHLVKMYPRDEQLGVRLTHLRQAIEQNIKPEAGKTRRTSINAAQEARARASLARMANNAATPQPMPTNTSDGLLPEPSLPNIILEDPFSLSRPASLAFLRTITPISDSVSVAPQESCDPLDITENESSSGEFAIGTYKDFQIIEKLCMNTQPPTPTSSSSGSLAQEMQTEDILDHVYFDPFSLPWADFVTRKALPDEVISSESAALVVKIQDNKIACFLRMYAGADEYLDLLLYLPDDYAENAKDAILFSIMNQSDAYDLERVQYLDKLTCDVKAAKFITKPTNMDGAQEHVIAKQGFAVQKAPVVSEQRCRLRIPA